MSGYAKTIAEDVIAQLAATGETTPWPVTSFTAEYQRMYISDLETMEPAGGSTSEMQLVLAPVEEKYERTGWGAMRTTVTIGILFAIKVEMANKVITDPNIDSYEQLVDAVCGWLIGPRYFAGTWNASDPVPVFGDHYNKHLNTKEEFHVPVLVDFFQDVGVA